MMHFDSFLAVGLTWLRDGNYFIAITFLLCLCSIAYYSVTIAAAVDFFFHSPEHRSNVHPPVSILIPICGSNDSTYANLASFCQQDYPDYQIVFGIQSPQDSSIQVVKQLMQAFPDVEISLVVSDRSLGMNHKVSNLANAAIEAKHNLLLLVDGDIRVRPNYLKHVVPPLHDPTVGVVTCMYRSLTYEWLSAFEALSITTEFIPRILAAKRLQGMSFALGATIVIRKTVLEAIGGFPAVANDLEDDYQLGKLSTQVGYQVVLSDYVVDHVMATESLAEFTAHQTRWARGNRFARPIGHLSLIVTYGTVSSLLLVLITDGSLLSWSILLVTWAMRLAMAWFVGVQQLQDTVARSFFWLVPLRDVISFTFWCYSFLGNTICWRRREFRLTKGAKLMEETLLLPLPKTTALTR